MVFTFDYERFITVSVAYYKLLKTVGRQNKFYDYSANPNIIIYKRI